MGVAGMLVMIPLAAVGYTLLREVTEKRLAQKEIPLEKLENAPLHRKNNKDTAATRILRRKLIQIQYKKKK